MENYSFQSGQSFPKETKITTVETGATKAFMSNVFGWMFGALFISGFFAYLFAGNLQLLSYLVAERGLSPLGYIVMFAPIGFVLLMSFGFQRLSAPVMAILFIVYAMITGISFSFILLAYTASSVYGCFFSAAAMFGVMAVMGYTTKKDLTGFGSIMIMGLIGIVIASLVNMFLRSTGMDYIISFVGILVFTGLTAYDVQKLKNIGSGADMQDATSRKLAIYGALSLYLDFINLFLMLLRFFGNRRK